MKTIIILIFSALLISCGRMADGTSVWAEGMWLIPTVLLLLSAGCFALAYSNNKSGSIEQHDTGTTDAHFVESYKNVPIQSLGTFWFGVILAVATIVVIILVNADK